MKSGADRKANPKAQPELQMAAMERALAAEERLVPASGFLAAVMDRVREEASAPAPIPFPWKRIAPGLVLGVGILGWAAWHAAPMAWAAMHGISLKPPQIPAPVLLHLKPAAWVAMSLAISWIAWAVSMRIVRRSRIL
jgi:hypothetical protein